MGELDDRQSASAGQFDRQSDRYGRSHILADTSDVTASIERIIPSGEARALDVATGGGHTALWLARHGWQVTAGDVSRRMLENTSRLLGEEGFTLETRLFPAEEMPFENSSFDMVTCRTAAHHFSSPERFVQEAARVLRDGGHFLLIDGTVPDDDPVSEAWLHRVEKWRDPSHGRFLPRKEWEDLALSHGFTILKSEIHPKKQPDLEWYFETADTAPGDRELVREAVATAPVDVRHSLRLTEEEGKTVWWWPILSLVVRK